MNLRYLIETHIKLSTLFFICIEWNSCFLKQGLTVLPCLAYTPRLG